MSEVILKKQCSHCQHPFSGNDNKRFCNDRCKNAFNNARRKSEHNEIGKVINILKTNRRIIADLLKEKEIRSVAEQVLLDKKFVFRYHTHTRINKGDGKEYVFCFDYGYIATGNGWYKILKAFKDDD